MIVSTGADDSFNKIPTTYDIKTNLTRIETEGNFHSMIFIKVYQRPTKAIIIHNSDLSNTFLLRVRTR